MRGAMLYAPARRALRGARRPDRSSNRPTPSSGCRRPACAGPTCGPTAASSRRRARPDGPRVRRHRRGGRQRRSRTIKPGQFVVGSFFASDNTCPICRAGYQTRCVHAELMGAIGTQAQYAAHPAGRRHPGRHPGAPGRRPDPEPARRLRRARHRLVRRRRRRGRPGQDRRGRRRRRGRPARRARRQAAGRRADHRDEPPRAAPAAGPRVRRDRHRHRTRRRGRGRGSRSSPTGSARTRSSRPSAPRSR